jgi:hypothetical protein
MGNLPTAVSRNDEKCAKFTFLFSKNFYLREKYNLRSLSLHEAVKR